MTLFTAQTDFTEPGELALFIDDSEVSLLEAQMEETGFPPPADGGRVPDPALQRPAVVARRRRIPMGERAPMNDLMAWNADATRMPARMHSQYLRRLFLNDDQRGRYPVGGKPVALSDIELPVFCVATSPTTSRPGARCKLHYLVPTEISFVLTSGGHNAGIVSEPAARGAVSCAPAGRAATTSRRTTGSSARPSRKARGGRSGATGSPRHRACANRRRHRCPDYPRSTTRRAAYDANEGSERTLYGLDEALTTADPEP